MSGKAFRFTVMGSVRGWLGDVELALGGPQQRALLGLLLIRTRQTVAHGEIANLLWRDSPPSSAANVVHHHVSTLRRLLEPGLRRRDPGRWLVRCTGGYRLDIAPECVDLHVFGELTERARAHAANGEWQRAAALYGDALALHQGPIGAGRDADRLDPGLCDEVEHLYVKAIVDAAESHLRIGDGHRVLALVRRSAERRPWDERLQAALIRLLGATGRQADALDVYRTVRGRLADELGIEPGAELRAAQTAVLRQSTPTAGGTAAPLPGAAGPGPLQLPADLVVFAGRDAALARINAAADRSAAPAVVTISGMPGIGKTALAVRAAHRLTYRFPDGQLFVNLRGFDTSAEPMTSEEALRHLLDSLGVRHERFAVGLAGLLGLYRGLLAGRRVVVVLDNARDARQVRPLLPATPGCMAIVTSRNVLEGLLVTDGADPVCLPELTPQESHAVLVGHLGPVRVAAESKARDDIVAACAGVPIALAVVAARAALNPHRSLSEIAVELKSADNGLDAFRSADPDMDLRCLLSASYRRLDDDAARLFRRLALRPAAPIRPAAAAALADVPLARCRHLLADLVAESLLSEPVAGGFRMHELVADYAHETCHRTDSAGERSAAVERLRRYPNGLHRDATALADAPNSLSSTVGHGIGTHRKAAWPVPLDSNSVRAN